MLRTGLLCVLLAAAGTAGATESAATLARDAVAAYSARDYARSADLFAAAATADRDRDPGVLYNAACAAALAGRREAAIDLLRRAFAAGWSDAAHARKDTDLATLQSDPRVVRLLANADAARARDTRLWSSPAFTTPWGAPLGEDARVAGLSRLWSEAKFNFANFDLVPELDWDAAYLEALPKVRAARDVDAYFRELEAFVARLNDGHSNVFPTDLANYDRWYARPGLSLRYVERQPLVTAVFDPRLQALGVRPGWAIERVAGRPVREYADAQVRPYISASTEHDRLSRIYERFLLAGAIDAPVDVVFRDAAGTAHALTLPRMSMKAVNAATPDSAPFAFDMLPGDVAWVRLRSFGDDTAANEFEANFERIHRARAVILDVRENGGGNSTVGYRILSHLVDRPFRTSRWATRDYRPTLRAWGRAEARFEGEAGEVAPAAGPRFAGPVVVLTSARTYSAAEDFAVAFDAMKRGTIVGETTGGSTGQPLIFPLGGGISARVCTKRDTYPDGREFVGVGVRPQVAVAPTVRDVRAGRDTVLEAALGTIATRR